MQVSWIQSYEHALAQARAHVCHRPRAHACTARLHRLWAGLQSRPSHAGFQLQAYGACCFSPAPAPSST
eukprot:10279289-Alexandrium_andersonii.AAC.1